MSAKGLRQFLDPEQQRAWMELSRSSPQSTRERRPNSARWAPMDQDKLYDEATDVTAKDGEVILDGPDAVDVKVTPEAAEQTADNLIEGAMKAHGQRRLKGHPHQPRG